MLALYVAGFRFHSNIACPLCRLQAERDFSIKKSLESPRKKLAGPDYFNSAMFVACNKKHLRALIVGPVQARTDHFTELLTRARKVGRGLTRIASRANRKRRREAVELHETRRFIDLSSSSDSESGNTDIDAHNGEGHGEDSDSDKSTEESDES